MGSAAWEGDPGLAFFDALADDPVEAEHQHAARRGILIEREAMRQADAMRQR